MGKQFKRKQGLKKHKFLENFNKSKNVKKNDSTKEETSDDPSPASSEDFSEGESGAADSEVAQKESSTYDNLLMTLQSCNKSIANAYKKRKRDEAGRSDSEEDDTGSLSEEEDASEEDTDDEFLRSDEVDNKLQEQSSRDRIEDAESEDEKEASDIDEEHNLGVNAQKSTSSFYKHLGYILSEEEVQNLSKKKWEYKWEVPATDILNCKLLGTRELFLKGVDLDSSHGLKLKLYKHWLDVYKTSGGSDFYSSKQRFFFSLCNSYMDILHCNKKPFYLKGQEEDSSIMDAYIMHFLNHIFSSRDLLKKNDSKLAKNQESADDASLVDGYLDRGFTRPKVLILLPFRNIALRLVKRLIQLTPQAYKVNVEHADRFYDEYGSQEDEDSDEFAQSVGNSKSAKSSKPFDHQALFSGNYDDDFMIGIKFTRRSIKLYSDFYSSDMIVASPVCLHRRIEKAVENKEFDVDFLSSIEVLLIDHADVIAMQNWAFLTNVVEHLNCIPSKQHGTDIMRIRKGYLDGNARFYRQTIILGHYVNPDVNALFNHQCVNYQGKVRSMCEYRGVLSKVLLPVRQIYERFDVKSTVDADDARLEYFVKKVFPKIKDSVQGGTMVFMSSYFEYVRLRNYLKSQNASFCVVADYTTPSDVSRARVAFFEGRKKIMLYTERFHFYRRYKMRGVQNLIIYSLPDRKEFYPEVVSMLEEANNMTCTVLFSKFDQLRLERIVGTSSAKRMLASEKNLFLFS
ncbi:protein NUCLEOLAR FACTOR 1 isoform X2 [Euphorbia lathyris]|uniref:protein NUCLEOLAR FACTOR 1 isoform X2 n=1 Tax=Euphorbia lathyris TaxID=212925 RepID=UPI0033142593